MEKVFPIAMLFWLIAYVDLVGTAVLRIFPANAVTGYIFVGSLGGFTVMLFLLVALTIFKS